MPGNASQCPLLPHWPQSYFLCAGFPPGFNETDRLVSLSARWHGCPSFSLEITPVAEWTISLSLRLENTVRCGVDRARVSIWIKLHIQCYASATHTNYTITFYLRYSKTPHSLSTTDVPGRQSQASLAARTLHQWPVKSFNWSQQTNTTVGWESFLAMLNEQYHMRSRAISLCSSMAVIQP